MVPVKVVASCTCIEAFLFGQLFVCGGEGVELRLEILVTVSTHCGLNRYAHTLVLLVA